jgi:hypothetical protein
MTENEVTGILFKLSQLGVTGIKAHYEGGGDSGAVEWIYYTTAPCETPDDVDDLIDEWGSNTSNLSSLDAAMYSDLEYFISDTILDDIEDWWNNEGGFGEMSILIPSGQYKINNSIRIYNTEEYRHDGDLLSNTEK